MKIRLLIVLLVFIVQVISCIQNNSKMPAKIEVKEVVLHSAEDDIALPPADLVSEFQSMHEWLQHICSGNKPVKEIDRYNIGLFESTEEKILYMVGLNTYKSGATSHTRIAFEPTDMYFRLPGNEWKGLDANQLYGQLLVQLRVFTGTEAYKGSFLATSNEIVFEPTGEIIWGKQ